MSMPSSSPLPDGPMLRYDSWSSGRVIDVLLLEKCLSNDRTEDNRTSSCAGLLHRRKRLTTVSVKVVSHHPTNTEGPVPGRLERLGLLLVSRVLSANHGPRAMRICTLRCFAAGVLEVRGFQGLAAARYRYHVPWRSLISHTGFKHDTRPASYSDLRAFRLRSRGSVAEHLPERQLRQPRQPRPDIKQTSNWKLRQLSTCCCLSTFSGPSELQLGLPRNTTPREAGLWGSVVFSFYLLLLILGTSSPAAPLLVSFVPSSSLLPPIEAIMTMHHQLNGSPGPNGVVKTRRSHRKSRNGCSECKRRHIRCDERRPACTNCTIAERACSFPPARQQSQLEPLPLPQLPHSPADSHLSRKSQHSPSSCEPDHPVPWPQCAPDASSTSPESVLGAGRFRFIPAPATGPQTLPSFTESFTNTAYHPPVPPGSLFTAEHLMLFYHVSDAMSDCILARGQIKVVLDIAIKHLKDAPYLIDQLLALSALHVAFTSKPGEVPLNGTIASYRNQATELQTRALSSFTRIAAMVPADDMATCVPRFLFASLLSNQVLAETLLQHQQPQPLPYHHDVMGGHGGGSGGAGGGGNGGVVNFHGFIERMIECIHLHRGILAQIRPTWDYLMQSELYPLLRITHDANIAAVTLSSGTECVALRQMIDAAASPLSRYGDSSSSRHLDRASAEACRTAIDSLQWAFDMHRALSEQDVPHAPSAFIVTIEAEYVNVLRSLLPEALVILAYLGVLIHRCRRFWTFGTAGANLIRAVAGFLGSQWHEPLAWPLKVIEEETD